MQPLNQYIRQAYVCFLCLLNSLLYMCGFFFFFFLLPAEVMVKVHVVDLKTESVAPPISIRAYLNQTVSEFKQLISKVIYSC